MKPIPLHDDISRRLDLLLVRENGAWGALTLRGLLLVGGVSVLSIEQRLPGEREHALSVLGMLPDNLLFDPRIFTGCKIAFFALGALWFLGRLLPWSAWLATASFTALLSLFVESESYTTHQFHVIAVLLWV